MRIWLFVQLNEQRNIKVNCSILSKGLSLPLEFWVSIQALSSYTHLTQHSPKQVQESLLSWSTGP